VPRIFLTAPLSYAAVGLPHGRGEKLLATENSQPINYHPQSGWFEDAPLKGGAVMVCPRWGRCCRKPSAEGTVIALPPLGAL
jgi:hypothetical protein